MDENDAFVGTRSQIISPPRKPNAKRNIGSSPKRICPSTKAISVRRKAKKMVCGLFLRLYFFIY